MKWKIVSLAAILFSCSHSRVNYAVSPDGKEGYIISCDDKVDCMRLVSENCPTGYRVIATDSQLNDIAAYNINNQVGLTHFEISNTIQVECRQPVYVTIPPPEPEVEDLNETD